MHLVVVFTLDPVARSPYRDAASDGVSSLRLLGWREPRAEALSSVSGVSLAPRRLPADGPFVLASYTERATAEGCLERVRAGGFDAGVIAADKRHLDRAIECRRVRVADRKVVLESAGERRAVEAEQVRLMLRGVRSSRAVGTGWQSAVAAEVGPLERRRKAPLGVVHEKREHVLYIRAGLGRPLLLVDQRLDYTALGAEMRPTAVANFVTVVDQLRSLCRRGVYDQRLTNQAQQTALLGPLPPADYLGVAFTVLEAALAGRQAKER